MIEPQYAHQASGHETHADWYQHSVAPQQARRPVLIPQASQHRPASIESDTTSGGYEPQEHGEDRMRRSGEIVNRWIDSLPIQRDLRSAGSASRPPAAETGRDDDKETKEVADDRGVWDKKRSSTWNARMQGFQGWTEESAPRTNLPAHAMSSETMALKRDNDNAGMEMGEKECEEERDLHPELSKVVQRLAKLSDISDSDQEPPVYSGGVKLPQNVEDLDSLEREIQASRTRGNEVPLNVLDAVEEDIEDEFKVEYKDENEDEVKIKIRDNDEDDDDQESDGGVWLAGNNTEFGDKV